MNDLFILFLRIAFSSSYKMNMNCPTYLPHCQPLLPGLYNSTPNYNQYGNSTNMLSQCNNMQQCNSFQNHTALSHLNFPGGNLSSNFDNSSCSSLNNLLGGNTNFNLCNSNFAPYMMGNQSLGINNSYCPPMNNMMTTNNYCNPLDSTSGNIMGSNPYCLPQSGIPTMLNSSLSNNPSVNCLPGSNNNNCMGFPSSNFSASTPFNPCASLNIPGAPFFHNIGPMYPGQNNGCYDRQSLGCYGASFSPMNMCYKKKSRKHHRK